MSPDQWGVDCVYCVGYAEARGLLWPWEVGRCSSEMMLHYCIELSAIRMPQLNKNRPCALPHTLTHILPLWKHFKSGSSINLWDNIKFYNSANQENLFLVQWRSWCFIIMEWHERWTDMDNLEVELFWFGKNFNSKDRMIFRYDTQ